MSPCTALNYLEAFKLEVGLPLNFGAKSLEFRRLTMKRKLKNQRHHKISKICGSDLLRRADVRKKLI